MPRPFNERQSLEQELAELPAQMATYRHELENRPSITRARRERLEWEIRRVQKRMADVEARLAKVSAEIGPQP
jgi:chromosome segregation ATPase